MSFRNPVAVLAILSVLALSSLSIADSGRPLDLSTHARASLMSYLSRVNAQLASMSGEELADHFSYRDAKNNRISLRRSTFAGPEWALLDIEKDKTPGTSTERAYGELKMSTPEKPVIVAVVDSGVDIKHEDLAERIWVNEAEQNGKPGVDDDANGFVDDVNGWNFIGSKDGKNVGSTSFEVSRELGRLKRKEAKDGLSADERKYLALIEVDYAKQRSKYAGNLDRYKSMLAQLEAALEVLKKAGLTEESVEAVKAIKSEDKLVLEAQKAALALLERGATTKALKEAIAEQSKTVDVYFGLDVDPSQVIGDDPSKLDEKGYGNPDVIAIGADHGTHVSGIIGAVRDNGVGMNGQAHHVRIMPVRAVPDGDERDKDVANAVRYAVDNGAQVINMSFGKLWSPNKAYVDAAFKYAAEKNVVVVHAAGNSSENNDVVVHFPTRRFGVEPGSEGEPKNWIEVGASTRNADAKLPATFSNYGVTSVDLFAPGSAINSTIPGNGYAEFSGTSMATPEVAGVAALVLSQNPSLSAEQVRALLMSSARGYRDLTVNQPGGGLIKFAELSITGGVLNALEALRAAR